VRTGIVAVVVAAGSLVGRLSGLEAGDDRTPDVVVYGGTSAGVAAAVQVARMGRSVVLVAPERHIGGMSSSGLGFTDTGDRSVIGGLAREVYHRIWLHYERPDAWRFEKREAFGNRGQGTPAVDGERETMWLFEPHVAETVFEEMLREAKVEVVRGERLDRRSGVRLKGHVIQSMKSLSGRTYRAKTFVDATYEGDLMAAAGVSYHVGREANAVYGERWNGVQNEARHHRHFFSTRIDPFIEPGSRGAGLLPGVSIETPGPTGSGDRKIQSYCYRLCLTDVPENRVPFPRPDGYDPIRYELLLRLVASGWREVFAKFDRLPNGKTDTNNHGPVSMDFVGESWAYPDATDDERRAIVLDHEHYQKGLLYFLSNDSRVPSDVRIPMGRFGLARDEFQDNGNWPYQLYVREARRMVGEYVMTEHDCFGARATPDPVGMASYPLDSHNVQRYVKPEGFVQNEGDVGVEVPRPYGVAYGSLVPKKGECLNLVVPVAVSASHIAYGSIRMEPVFLILGQSAATAAVLAIEEGVSVQDVDRAALRARLLADGQILERPPAR